MALNSILSHIDIGERELALQQLQHCKKGDLVIYDRGYPSYDLFHEHYEKNVAFVIRAKSNFNSVASVFLKSGKTSQVVEFFPGQRMDLTGKTYNKNTPIKVRLIRIELPGGETELLITSLTDSKKYKHNIFKELYFRRWKIETYFDELKNKLGIEHFSGYSNQSILQDFYAAIFVSNLQSLIVTELAEELAQNTDESKYSYKVNTALSYGFMKDRILTVFFKKGDMNPIITELKDLFRGNLVPIRPERSNPRNVWKYKVRMKPKVTKNQKNTL